MINIVITMKIIIISGIYEASNGGKSLAFLCWGVPDGVNSYDSIENGTIDDTLVLVMRSVCPYIPHISQTALVQN